MWNDPVAWDVREVMTLSLALLTTVVALVSLATTSLVLTAAAVVFASLTLLAAVASLTGDPLVVRRRDPSAR